MVVTESEDRNDTLKNVDLEKAVDELKSQFIEGGADEYEMRCLRNLWMLRMSVKNEG